MSNVVTVYCAFISGPLEYTPGHNVQIKEECPDTFNHQNIIQDMLLVCTVCSYIQFLHGLCIHVVNVTYHRTNKDIDSNEPAIYNNQVYIIQLVHQTVHIAGGASDNTHAEGSIVQNHDYKGVSLRFTCTLMQFRSMAKSMHVA